MRVQEIADLNLRTIPVPLTDFASAPLAEARWAVRNIWPEGASGIIGGRPKDGKSTLATELAISLWSGTPMFDRTDDFPVLTRPASVLYVQQENSTNRVQRDTQAILAARGLGVIMHEEIDDEVFSIYDAEPGDEEHALHSVGYHFALRGIEEPPRFDMWSQPGLDLSKRDQQELLRQMIIEHGYRYVFLDPLYMLVGSARVTDGGDELRPILSWLTALRNETGAAMILTHHMTNKHDAPNSASSLLGATWIPGWYEAALLTRRSHDRTFSIKVDAVRDMSYESEIVITGQGVGHWFYSQAAQNRTDSLDRPAPRVAGKASKLELVRELLAEDPTMSIDDLAAATEFSRSTVHRYVNEIRAAEPAPAPVDGHHEP